MAFHDVARFIDHWQTLVAGILGIIAGSFALLAALLSARRAERLSHEKDQQEIEAARNALANEIRWFVSLLLETHAALLGASGKRKIPKRAIERYASLRPVIYPAVAHKVSLLGNPLAQDVIAFYGKIQHIQFEGRFIVDDPTAESSDVSASPDETQLPTNGTKNRDTSRLLDRVASRFDEACRKNAPPLLDLLPPDKRDADLKARIEAMDRPPSSASGRDDDGA
jgi:hypothetical protein